MASTKEEPRPEMFGFGKHMCSGRELAKLELICFMKAFLANFDYKLTEGQVSHLSYRAFTL